MLNWRSGPSAMNKLESGYAVCGCHRNVITGPVSRWSDSGSHAFLTVERVSLRATAGY